jgi:hypothetical protein
VVDESGPAHWVCSSVGRVCLFQQTSWVCVCRFIQGVHWVWIWMLNIFLKFIYQVGMNNDRHVLMGSWVWVWMPKNMIPNGIKYAFGIEYSLLKNESQSTWNEKTLSFSQAIGAHLLGCAWTLCWKNIFWIHKNKLIHLNVFDKDPTYGCL